MAQSKVLVTPIFLKPGDETDQKLRAAGVEPIYNYWHGGRTEDELISLLDGVDGCIASLDPFTPKVLSAVKGKLKVICRTGVGYDSIDVKSATENDIAVCITPGTNRHAVAEFAMGLIIQCGRKMIENLSEISKGSWQRHEGRDLAGATVGLVGMGAIGQEVAQRARAFEMRVLAYDPYQDPVFAESQQVTYVSMDELLKESDYISLHVFLNDQTRHLINAEKLAMMKPTAYLINTARGPIIDSNALYHALKEKRIAGAALDVFDQEPLEANSPLRELDNIYMAPHAAAYTRDFFIASGLMAAENVLRRINGERPLAIVNPEVLK